MGVNFQCIKRPIISYPPHHVMISNWLIYEHFTFLPQNEKMLLIGHRPDFLLPDRNQYVSMDRHFLKSYMDLVVQTCHKRGCHATGGMAALLLPKTSDENHTRYQTIQDKVLR